MGNRAVITDSKKEIGIYLHLNGGRDSVEAFLRYCKDRCFRTPNEDCYGWARLCQVIGNYFGADGLSIGIDLYKNLDFYCENGVYIIENWEIIDREHFEGAEQSEYKLEDMLDNIDKAQPEEHKIYITEKIEEKEHPYKGKKMGHPDGDYSYLCGSDYCKCTQ